MAQYVDILLTKDGYFCVAPAWEVKVGDLIGLPNELRSGEDRIREIISVSTDSVDGEHIKQIEKYIGYPLPRITSKYLKSEVEWIEETNVLE